MYIHMVYQAHVKTHVKEDYLVIWQNACETVLNDSVIT